MGRIAQSSCWKRIGAAGSVLLIAGCSFLDPHQHAPELNEHSYAKPTLGGEAYAGDLAVAIDDANAQRNRYLNAVVEASEAENASPLVAGGLIISSLMLGATGGGSSNLRLGLASGGAAAFAFSRLYDTRTRQMIWLNGADAIGCAVATQRPLLITVSADQRLPDDVRRVRAGLDALAEALRDNPTRVPGSHWQTQNIASLQQTALSDLASVSQLIQARASAGLVLRERVRAIQIAVDKQLISTNPDPNAIFALVRDFTNSLQTLAPAQAGVLTPSGANQTNAKASKPDPVDLAADKLKSAVDDLEADMTPLAQITEAQAALARCTLADLPNSFVVSPNETLHVVNKVEATLTYVVRGGSGQIVATISQTDAPDGAITATAAVQPDRSYQVLVKLTKDAAGHKAELLISDDSRQPPRQILLNVLNASVSPSSTKNGGAKIQPANKTANQSTSPFTPTPDQLDVVRQVLGLSATRQAALSDDEKTKLGVVAKSQGRDPSTPLDAKLYAVLLAQYRQVQVTKSPSDDVKKVELQLVSSSQAADLRIKCGQSSVAPLPADTLYARIFDSAFRGAILDFQNANDRKGGKLAITGFLDTDTAGAIDAADCKVK